jgi:digeranylgeranylglycerophospholipid reductase
MQIAIVGAGINGLYLAQKLSQKGNKVVVFERKEEIGQRACSGLFSSRILNFFPEASSLIQNKIDYTLIHFPKKTIRVNFKRPFFVIDHFKLDQLAASCALASGAEILLNKNIKKIPEEFDMVIGCDGPNSIIRKELGLKDPKFRLGILGMREQKFSSCENYVEAWPVKDGFIWKIPRCENIEYGIIAPPEKANSIFKRFLDKNNIILKNIESKIVPQGFIFSNNRKIALAGDATGLTKPWSGGGVIWQLTMDNIFIKNFPNFKKYKREAVVKMTPKIAIGKIAVAGIYFLGFNFPFFLPAKNKIESDFLILK